MRRKTITQTILGFWIGFAPFFLYQSGFTTWKWWAFVIPTFILVELYSGSKPNK